ncbi:GntR family transcriptional regulator [Streptomyces eurythermus]
MRLLGASRNSVREALKALQAMGIVEIRQRRRRSPWTGRSGAGGRRCPAGR